MPKITLTKEQFKLLNAAVKSAIDTSGGRPMLQYAKLEIKKGQIKVIALDGYKMTVLSFKDDNQEPETFTCFYQPLPLPAKARTVEIESIEETKTCKLTFYSDAPMSKTEIPQHKGDWLRWEEVMNRGNKNETAICVNPKFLIDALQAHSTAQYVKIKLAPKGTWVDDKKPIIIESDTAMAAVETLILPYVPNRG